MTVVGRFFDAARHLRRTSVFVLGLFALCRCSNALLAGYGAYRSINPLTITVFEPEQISLLKGDGVLISRSRDQLPLITPNQSNLELDSEGIKFVAHQSSIEITNRAKSDLRVFPSALTFSETRLNPRDLLTSEELWPLPAAGLSVLHLNNPHWVADHNIQDIPPEHLYHQQFWYRLGPRMNNLEAWPFSKKLTVGFPIEFNHRKLILSVTYKLVEHKTNPI